MHSHSALFARFAAPGMIVALGCLLQFSPPRDQARAATAAAQRAIYVVSEFEGYGVADCLTQRMECGQLVADSWCKAHGHGPALSYGRADDVAGSTGTDRRPTTPQADAAVVACKE